VDSGGRVLIPPEHTPVVGSSGIHDITQDFDLSGQNTRW